MPCEGGSVCEHKKLRIDCRICDPLGFLAKRVSGHVRRALRSDKSKRSIEYLGCDIETYKKYLEDQFVDEMSWENYGSVWEIDHIVPIKYKKPTLEEVTERLHYKNTQPLWSEVNTSKGNRFILKLVATGGRPGFRKALKEETNSNDSDEEECSPHSDLSDDEDVDSLEPDEKPEENVATA